jgi:WD40 repeat protein
VVRSAPQGCAESYGRCVTGAVNAVCAHPSMELLFSGHRDKAVRFWDARSSQCAATIAAHQDAVTGVAVDYTGLRVVSSGVFTFAR